MDLVLCGVDSIRRLQLFVSSTVTCVSVQLGASSRVVLFCLVFLQKQALSVRSSLAAFVPFSSREPLNVDLMLP